VDPGCSNLDGSGSRTVLFSTQAGVCPRLLYTTELELFSMGKKILEITDVLTSRCSRRVKKFKFGGVQPSLEVSQHYFEIKIYIYLQFEHCIRHYQSASVFYLKL
jgi:hypothetical protein